MVSKKIRGQLSSDIDENDSCRYGIATDQNRDIKPSSNERSGDIWALARVRRKLKCGKVITA